MSDPWHPGLATRVRAHMRGERDAKTLEALRAAGAGVYQELAEAEQERAALLAGGLDLWRASSPSTSRPRTWPVAASSYAVSCAAPSRLPEMSTTAILSAVDLYGD